ncbi:Ethanolamine ammonia-lyase light chain [Shewanella denitrificans OS217]|uniref:Ethanolamine ammonia-lyase small subunit n=1 Tax=Shewanella denitrificans (strain OS217 / ATCC BAA-1090 / DSM 15013) TaxID=318161 RepID=Q12QB6_SHEDO|nr:Ethanolamine ammonia-lyase light chain [Shewanella denitrificans OS217]
MRPSELVQADPWPELMAFTQARISLGRVGTSLPTAQVQALALAHAMARDAVHLPLDVPLLAQGLKDLGFDTLTVTSQANNRSQYLLRPDLGRRLHERHFAELEQYQRERPSLLLVIADGLSSLAVARHSLPLIKEMSTRLPKDWTLAPVVIATQGRVALGDEIAQRLNATMVAILIGERPGLTTPDSLGVYFTYAPRVGCSDAMRNCISNIHPQGLDYASAATKLIWLAKEALKRRVSGVMLKDTAPVNHSLT